jgi:hypothetical protein
MLRAPIGLILQKFGFFMDCLCILLSVLFSDTLRLHSSLSVSNQVSDPYKTTGRITDLCIIMFKYLYSKLEDKRSCTKFYAAFPDFSQLLISSLIWFWFVNVVPNYLNSSTLSKELLSVFILWLPPAFWSRDMTTFFILYLETSQKV